MGRPGMPGPFAWRRWRDRGSGRRKIFVFREGCGPDEGCVRRLGAEKVRHLPLVNAVVAHFPGDADVAALDVPPEIERVDEDLVLHIVGGPGSGSPDDPGSPPRASRRSCIMRWLCRRRRYPSDPGPPQRIPWGIEFIYARQAWALTRGVGVKVGVIDTGIDLHHPDLRSNIAGGHNVLNPGRDPADDNGHGTHVAGTIAAADDDIGVAGVAPQAKLYAVKALDRFGIGYLSDLIEALDWCIKNGIAIVNLSLGTREDNRTFHDAVRRAWQAGVTVVAAAGNDGPGENTVNYPGKYPETICVSAVDADGRLARFASSGPEVDLVAPGVDILSTWPGGGYRSLNGTSMASPHVAGVAALVAAARPDSGPDEISKRLAVSSRRLIGVPWGLVNASRAVR